MMVPDYVFAEMQAHTRGMALHYPFLYGAVVGLEPSVVVEFGAGMSTRVILDALTAVGGTGRLLSCSTDAQADLAARHGFAPTYPHWGHVQMLSSEWRARNWLPWTDLILHDGAHDAETVEADLRFALPRLRRFGLCLIHDTQHEAHGEGIRRAVERATEAAPYSAVTVPYGFGLTILRCEDVGRQPVEIRARKVGSPYRTVPA